jgi:predicted restriction endonuclease
MNPPVPIPAIADQLLKLLPFKYSPLTRHGTGAQGYLFHLPAAAADLILGRATASAQPQVDPIVNAINRLPLDQTTRRALVESRVGQGRFRQDLLALWDGRCAVTALSVKALLRASHIKPWRAGNNAERLDVYNGLLLAPSYDAAFDSGLIPFDDSGRLLVSPALESTAFHALGLDPKAVLRFQKDAHQVYLKYHREEVFETGVST